MASISSRSGRPPGRRAGRAGRLLGGVLGAPVALVALAPAASAETLSDVVVSANRTEQRSFDTPASIQAVSRETIEEAGPQVNLSESLNRVPGTVVLNRQNYAQDLQLSIRGFGARSTFGIRGVRLLVDGIPATMPDGQGQASTISLPSTARIEVLRGPLAQLYGNAAGGVIQAFTMDGPAVPTVSGTLDTGSYGLRRYGAQAGGQAGRMNYLADYSWFEIDGYREHSAARRRQLNAKLRFDAGEGSQLTVVANLFNQPLSQDPLGLTRAQFEANPRQAQPIAIALNTGKTVSQNQVGAVLDQRVGSGGQFSARVYVGERDLDNLLGVPLAAQLAPTSSGGAVKLDRSYAGVGLQYSQRWSSGVGQWYAVGGIDYDWMKDKRQGFINNNGVIGALKRNEDDRVTNLGVYGQLNWLFDPSWTLTAGFRSTHVDFRVDDYYITAGNPNDSGSVSYGATNPMVGLTWHAAETLNLYANFGRGFETPTFTELAYRPGASGMNFNLNASASRSGEVGAKARFAGQRVDLALFRIDTENEIIVDANVGGRTTYRNAGNTRRTGMELSWLGRLPFGLFPYLSATWMNAEFVDSYVGAGGTRVNAGNKLPGVPSNRYIYGELAWRPALGGPLAGFAAAVEALHSGKLYVNDANTDAAASYTIMNLRAGLEQRVGAWRFRELVRLDNVTDRNYAGSVIVNDANGRYFEAALRRNWLLALTAAYEFR